MAQTETTIYHNYEKSKIKRIDSLRDRHSDQHKFSQIAIILLAGYLPVSLSCLHLHFWHKKNPQRIFLFVKDLLSFIIKIR